MSVVRHHNSPASCQRDAFISSRTITSISSSCLCAKCFPSPSRRRDLSHDDSTETAIDSNRFHHQMSANVSCIRATHAHRTAMSKLSPAPALKHVIRAAPSKKRSRPTGQAKLERILQPAKTRWSRSSFFQILCARLCPSLRMSDDVCDQSFRFASAKRPNETTTGYHGILSAYHGISTDE